MRTRKAENIDMIQFFVPDDNDYLEFVAASSTPKSNHAGHL